MPDWKDPADYEFTKSLDRAGWAWEFMRRNSRYKADYLRASKAGKGDVVYKPPKKKGETDNAWRARVTLADGQPWKRHLSVALARKWHMTGAICNPDGPALPRFATPYPEELGSEDLRGDMPFITHTENLVLLRFDLARPLPPQHERAMRLLKQRQQERLLKGLHVAQPRNLSKQWTTFLRLLDGEAAGVNPKELRKGIAEYHKLKKSDYGDKKKLTDRFSDNRKVARLLRKRPLSIL